MKITVSLFRYRGILIKLWLLILPIFTVIIYFKTLVKQFSSMICDLLLLHNIISEKKLFIIYFCWISNLINLNF